MFNIVQPWRSLATTPISQSKYKRGLMGTFTCGVLAISLGGCLDLYGDSKSDNSAKIELTPAANAAEFKNYLTARFTQLPIEREYSDGEIGVTEAMADTAAVSESAPVSAGDAFSATNNQVAGVDEGDIWKYDGTHFYVLQKAVWDYQYGDCYQQEVDMPVAATNLAGDTLDIMPCYSTPILKTPAQLRVVKNTQETLASVEFEQMSPSELYLSEDAIVVLGNKSSYQNSWNNYQNWQDGQTDIQVLDVSDVTAPISRLDIKVDGYVVQSRRIEDELFIITRYTPNLPEMIYYPSTSNQIEQNKQILSELSLDELIPSISINDQSQPLVSVDNCLLADTPTQQWGYPTLSTITRIDINTGEFSSRCMAGEVAGIYMSEENLYLFNTSYWDYSEETDDGLATWNWSQGNTHLHKFALQSFNYQGSAIVQGRLGWDNPRFRLGELHDGSLAVVTTDGQWRAEDHHLTVLSTQDGELKTLATLPNSEQPAAIGKPGEHIYSVRFMQNRAYIVTFQKVDPLYVIDLTNPAHPSIAGELEIPGFSDYLHPIGDDLLLGIGKDAIMGDSGTTWYQGVKVSLFNVSDIQNPSELGNILIGKRGSNTALSYEPHAFSGIQQDGQYRFAFPVSEHNGEASGNYWRDPESQHYNWTQSGLYLFEIEDNQLSQSGAMITERNDDTQEWQNWNQRRGLIQGDDVYHLSGGDLYHATWNDPQQLSNKF